MHTIYTCSDLKHLPYGLTLYRSLKGEANLIYLGLDEACVQKLKELSLPKLEVIEVSNVVLLESFPRIPNSLFCWAACPFGLKHILAEKESVWYIDADVLFFDIFSLWEVEKGCSVGLISHEVNNGCGRYNTGTIFFNRQGLGCLDFWISLVLNKNNEFARTHGYIGFQAYAELFADRFDGVRSLDIVQGGMWSENLSFKDGIVSKNGKFCSFCHFNSVREWNAVVNPYLEIKQFYLNKVKETRNLYSL